MCSVCYMVHAYEYPCMHAHIRRLQQDFGCHFYSSSCYCFEACLTEPGACWCLQAMCRRCLAVYVNATDLNSGVRACRANTLILWPIFQGLLCCHLQQIKCCPWYVSQFDGSKETLAVLLPMYLFSFSCFSPRSRSFQLTFPSLFFILSHLYLLLLNYCPLTIFNILMLSTK